MQSTDELLCVLNLSIQAFHLIHQLHQSLSLLDIFCLNLHTRSGIMLFAKTCMQQQPICMW